MEPIFGAFLARISGMCPAKSAYRQVRIGPRINKLRFALRVSKPTQARSKHCDRAKNQFGVPAGNSGGWSEAGRVPGLVKTMLCKFYKDGKCRRGDACSYAHSKGELRAVPATFVTTKSLWKGDTR